ncbi:MAG: hypothetical protein RLP16_05325 [Alphaproteobacteria bacterium]
MTRQDPKNSMAPTLFSRRQILASAAAGGAVAALPIGAFAAGLPDLARPGRVPHAVMIFDTRYAPAVEFGRAARRVCGLAAARCHDFEGDLGRFWSALGDQLRGGDTPLLGMTQDSDFVLLRHLARDAGLVPVFQARHRPGRAGGQSHEISGPADAVRALAASLAPSLAPSSGGEESWPHAAAEAIRAIASGETGPAPSVRREIAGAPGNTAYRSRVHLVSWLFQPAAKTMNS